MQELVSHMFGVLYNVTVKLADIHLTSLDGSKLCFPQSRQTGIGDVHILHNLVDFHTLGRRNQRFLFPHHIAPGNKGFNNTCSGGWCSYTTILDGFSLRFVIDVLTTGFHSGQQRTLRMQRFGFGLPLLQLCTSKADGFTLIP